MKTIICSMPECQTTAGCSCQRSGIVWPTSLRDPADAIREENLRLRDLIEQQAAKITEMERRIADGESDENKGLWRFWNDKARELSDKLAVMTSSRDGYAKQDAARFVEVRRLALDEAAMVAEDYGDTYSVGRGVARAIRSLKKVEQA